MADHRYIVHEEFYRYTFTCRIRIILAVGIIHIGTARNRCFVSRNVELLTRAFVTYVRQPSS